jgi:hypothetical protein
MTRRREWPAWLEALRPDQMTRERIRRAVMRRASPILASRRTSWLDLASEWATLLSPVAAAVALVFAGLAVLRPPSDTLAEAPPRVQELVEPTPGEVLPAVFTQDTVADLDVVLTAISDSR